MQRSGFSLVELSIVLVILGLLVGGILAGQSLIRASELRAVGTEYQRYVTATNAFRDKYFALPGDMTNATSIWGTRDAVAANCRNTAASTDATTCNGNGDGIILPSTGANEAYRFWQHLSNAGLIEGQYDGITHGATTYSSTAANSPKSKIGNSYWFSWNWGVQSGNGGVFDGVYGNFFMLGNLMTDNYPGAAILKPEEQYNIDTKLDDGRPATGKLVVNGLSCTDTTLPANLNANYLLSATTATCLPLFRNNF